MDRCNGGYDPARTIASQSEFVQEIAAAAGYDWKAGNVWRRHDELLQKIKDLRAQGER